MHFFTSHVCFTSIILALCTGIVRPAFSQSFWATNQTINSTEFSNEYVVGYSDLTNYINKTNGTSPTITIVDGAHVSGNPGIGLYNSSIANMSGGFVLGLRAHDDATANFSGGTVSILAATTDGTANMTGGTATSVAAVGHGTLDVSGGSILASASLYESAVGIVSGVTIGNLVNGSYIQGNFETHNDSQATVSNTLIGIDFHAYDNSVINLTEVTIVRNLIAENSGGGDEAVTLSGGEIGNNFVALGVNVVADGTTVSNQMSGTNATLTLSNMNIGTGGMNLLNSTAVLTNDVIDGNFGASGLGTVTMIGGTVHGSVNHSAGGPLTLDGVIVDEDVTFSAPNALTTLRIKGGSVGGGVNATNGNLTIDNNADITGHLRIDDVAAANISNITIGDFLFVNNRSVMNLQNVSVGSDLTIRMSTATVNDCAIGGTVNLILNSAVEFTAVGVAGDVNADSNFLFEMTGGNVDGDFTDSGQGEVELHSVIVTGGLTIGGRGNITLNTVTMGGNIEAYGFADDEIRFNGGTYAGSALFGGETRTIIEAGAIIAQNVSVEDDAQLILSSGEVRGDLTASGNVQLTMNGGTVAALGAFGSSTVNVTAGTVTTAVNAAGTATLNFSGGAVLENAIALEGGTLNMTAGAVGGGVGAYDNSTVNLTGGQVFGGPASGSPPVGLVVADSAHLFFHGATVFQGGTIRGAADAEIWSGQIVGTVNVQDSARLTIFGGAINGELNASGDAIVTLGSGGVFASDVELTDNARFTLTGGAVQGHVQAFDGVNVVMNSGSVASDVTLFHDATLHFTGGNIDSLSGTNNSVITVVNGKVDFGMSFSGNARATIENVSPGDNAVGDPHLNGSDNSIVIINGGKLSGLFGDNASHMTMNGGRIGGDFPSLGSAVTFNDHSQLILNGGTVDVPVTALVLRHPLILG